MTEPLKHLLEFCEKNSIGISCLFEEDRENEKQVIFDKFGAYNEVDRDFVMVDELRTATQSVVYFPSKNLYVQELIFKKSGIEMERIYEWRL